MAMEKIRDVQRLLMEAMTNFAIAEKAGDSFTSGYYMGRVHSYLDVLGGYTMLNSPWYSLWRQVFVSRL